MSHCVSVVRVLLVVEGSHELCSHGAAPAVDGELHGVDLPVDVLHELCRGRERREKWEEER